MILKYLTKKILKNQIFILLILFLVFFFQNLIRILDDTINNNISTKLTFFLLLFNIPKIIQLILPLSLFLSILLTLRKLYADSEITIMYSCGLHYKILIIPAMLLAMFTAVIAFINIFIISPIIYNYQSIIINEVKSNLNYSGLTEGQFKSLKNGNIIFFIKNIKNNKLNKIFLAQFQSNNINFPSIITAENGKIEFKKDGSQIIILNKGTSFECTKLLHNFNITNFNDYKIFIQYKKITLNNINDNSEQMLIKSLWKSKNQNIRAELHWRLTLVISVILMALLAVPVSLINPRTGNILNILFAILLYLFFFLLQTTLHSKTIKEKLDPILWLWGVNFIYFILILLLNLWNTILIRKFRFYLKKSFNV
ncbi:Lipopolysaccharide export system permease protein LptF [Serratia symbiotica]|nr:Lipopolysaccharide export system permease protein LptF [Serratia symbiotica]